ncbi:hypothetical protein A2Z33_02690 [Candidatus Gottesmanbacteria bacterium RBG_16_52_11]|uniref:DUF5666 domain-containing protein n=1 Tax=Candidatus Gottesmanbacteria bacterium RBG_16_52_11 TaxID=1798374 RepID=A0A1F5YML0_9BACT|nr:MAG: hypothetical protein A2Z33_02690 [Candidatus Gottesmanbacteria bacterium RBG_16_52_11]
MNHKFLIRSLVSGLFVTFLFPQTVAAQNFGSFNEMIGGTTPDDSRSTSVPAGPVIEVSPNSLSMTDLRENTPITVTFDAAVPVFKSGTPSAVADISAGSYVAVFGGGSNGTVAATRIELLPEDQMLDKKKVVVFGNVTAVNGPSVAVNQPYINRIYSLLLLPKPVISSSARAGEGLETVEPGDRIVAVGANNDKGSIIPGIINILFRGRSPTGMP